MARGAPDARALPGGRARGGVHGVDREPRRGDRLGGEAARDCVRSCTRPRERAQAKLAHIERLGGEIRLVGARPRHGQGRRQGGCAARDGVPFFEDGAEREQYEGYGDDRRESWPSSWTSQPAGIVVPVGNGALVGGIGLERRGALARDAVIAVAAKEAPVMADSWNAGRCVESDRSATFADGLAVRVAIPSAVNVLGEVVTAVRHRERAGDGRGDGRAVARGDPRRRLGRGLAGRGASSSRTWTAPLVLIVTGRNVDDDLFNRAVERPESFPD